MESSSFTTLGDLINASERERELLNRLGAALKDFKRVGPVVEAGLKNLPYDDYALLRAHFYDDVSAPKIANEFGLESPGVAESGIRSALDNLCSHVKQRGVDASPEQMRILLLSLGRRFRSRQQIENTEDNESEVRETATETEALSPETRARFLLGIQILVSGLARQRSLRVFQASQEFRRTSSGVRGAAPDVSRDAVYEIASAEDLERAAQALLQGGEEQAVWFEGDKRFGSEGLSLTLHFDPKAKPKGALVFSDLNVPDSDEPVGVFQVHVRGDGGSQTLEFSSEDGRVRVPSEAFVQLIEEAPDDRLNEAFQISVEY